VRHRLKQSFPFVLVFTTGMCIMAVELTASRLLAPFFGTSLFVWTNIIAVIMVALAAGYWVGGKISERRPQMSLLLKIIFSGGIFCFLIPFATKPLSIYLLKDFAVFTPASWLILISSFCATLVLFFIPIMLVGMTSPFLIKLLSTRHSDVGNVSGTIFAVSTIGSIIGTFLPSLVFIAWVGSKRTILIFAVILIIISVYGLARREQYLYLLGLMLVIGPFITPTTLRREQSTIVEAESVYQYIQVQQLGGMNLLKYNEGTGIQSIFDPDNLITGHAYFDMMAASPALFKEKNLQVLNIGLAGGTAVRGMTYLFDGIKNIMIDGVEIDEKVVEIAKDHFDLNLENLTIHIADGRVFTRLTKEKYKLVLVDAYSNQVYIPWHLTTDEFFQEVEAVMYDEGVMVINLNATSVESDLYRAVSNTIAHNFDYVYSMRVPKSFNYLIFASDSPIPFNNMIESEIVQSDGSLFALVLYLVESSEKVMYNQEIPILTDDKAPIENMTDAMYWNLLFKNLNL
jgi:spermidine synthase